MARRPRISDRRRVEELLARFEPEVRAAFLAAIRDLNAQIDFEALVEALRRGDLNAALRAVHVDAAAYRAIERAVTSVYIAGGEQMVAQLPTIRDALNIRVGIRFDPGNPRAAEFARRNIIQLSTYLADDQNAALRRIISEGLEAGAGPRRVATDIAGRYDARLQRRTGGLLGLTNDQARYNETVRQILRDPERIRSYFIVDEKTGAWKPRYTTTDRRFDVSVRKAIAEGRALDAETAGKIVARQRASLLSLRAETVARDQTAMAANSARREAMQQTLDAAGITDAMVERTWRATNDHRTRTSHVGLNGHKVRGMSASYVSPSGAMLRYPCDPDAPLEERIGCRCTETYKILRAEEVTNG